MKRKILVLAVLIVPVCMVAVAALAQGQHSFPGHGGGKFANEEQRMHFLFERLGLDESQLEQVSRIHEQRAAETESLREQVKVAHEELQRLSDAPELDEQAIRQIASEMFEAQTELIVLRAEMHQELREILSPEQFEQFKQVREHHHGMMRRHVGGAGSDPGATRIEG